MNISFHAWKAFVECPRKFYKQYVKWDKPTIEVNEYFTLYGRLVEKFFELYCNIWHFKTPRLSSQAIRQKLVFIYNGILNSSTVNWNLPYCKDSKQDIFNQACEDICTVMSSENISYFLNTKSEVTIGLILKNDHRLKGRLDFLHNSNIGNEVTIFDGKGTNKIGKNISNDQLYFYSLLYFFRFNKLPDHIGFFYYRFNTLVPVVMDKEILDEFRNRLAIDIKGMLQAEHPPTPCAKSCKYCIYFNEAGCPEGEKSRVSRMRGSKIKDIESNGEVVEFSF